MEENGGVLMNAFLYNAAYVVVVVGGGMFVGWLAKRTINCIFNYAEDEIKKK